MSFLGAEEHGVPLAKDERERLRLLVEHARMLGGTNAPSSISMLITLNVGTKSVPLRSSASSRSIASPRASGRANSARIANPRGPTSTIVPSGESTKT